MDPLDLSNLPFDDHWQEGFFFNEALLEHPDDRELDEGQINTNENPGDNRQGQSTQVDQPPLGDPAYLESRLSSQHQDVASTVANDGQYAPRPLEHATADGMPSQVDAGSSGMAPHAQSMLISQLSARQAQIATNAQW